MKRLCVVSLASALAVALLLPGALADVYTPVDFRTDGTSGVPSGLDFHGTETVTDDPGLPDDSRLWSPGPWGDSFTNDSANAVTWRWGFAPCSAGDADTGNAFIRSSGTSWYNDTLDAGGVGIPHVESNVSNGALIYQMPPGKDHLTRFGRNPAFIGDFTFWWVGEMGAMATSYSSDPANVTFAIVTDPAVFCGYAFNSSVPDVQGIGVFVNETPPDFSLTWLTPFVITGNASGSTLTLCGAPTVLGTWTYTYFDIRFARYGGNWRITPGPGAGSYFYSCYVGTMSQNIPVLSFSSRTFATGPGGGYVNLWEAHSNWYLNNPTIAVPMGTWYCDAYCETTGVQLLLPNADVTTGWTACAPNHYTCVDDSPPHDANVTEVHRTGLDAAEEFGTTNLALPAHASMSRILSVRPYVWALSTAPPGGLTFSLRTGAFACTNTTTPSLTVAYANYTGTAETWACDNSGPWTWASLNNTGIRLFFPGGAGTTYVTAVGLIVHFAYFPHAYGNSFTAGPFGDTTQHIKSISFDFGASAAWRICNVKLKDAGGTVIQTWAGCTDKVGPSHTYTPIVTATNTGPFLIYFEFGTTNSVLPAYVGASLVLTDRIQPPGPGTGGVPLQNLGWLINLLMICGVLGSVPFAFLLIMYRYRKGAA